MKLLSKISIFFLLVTISNKCRAQQQALFSQYMLNAYFINPAFGGIKNQMQLAGGVRSQWSGINGAPVSEVFSVTSPVNKGSMGLGLQFFHEEIGLHRTNNIACSYSYFISTKSNKIGFGIRPSLNMFSLNSSKATFYQAGDPSTINNGSKSSALTFDVGMSFTGAKFFAGISSSNVDEQKIVKPFNSPYFYELKRHVFAYSGYNFTLSKRFDLMPSVLVKYVQNAPVNIDVNSLFILDKKWIAGISYRSSGFINISAQFIVKEKLRLGYVLDYPINILQSITPLGTHEIFVGYEIRYKDKPMVTPRFL